jgi:branched-chain amino acid transport system substrate-binding protein
MNQRRTLLSILLVILLLPSSLFASGKHRGTRPATLIRIGGLFSLTGDGASLGTASAAALTLAVRDINLELDELHSQFRVESFVDDTRLTAAIAAQKIADLDQRGATFVIGPQSSSEAAAVRVYANEHDIILVSQGSTASSLAIPGDNLFRLAPNDKLEGAAMASLMRADGIDTVVPMWRNDAGNGGLHDSTKSSFEAAGGVMLGGAAYDPATTNFAAVVTALGATVRAARNQRPGAHIAVYLASFEEAAAIFDLARLDPDLVSIRWYGGDGVTQSQALLASAAIAQFAAATFFTAPNVGLDESARDRWQPVSDEIRSLVGFTPDAYALSVYDAAWVAVLSALEVDNAAALRRASFVRNVQRYWGLTGPTALDPAGDRKLASFDFWSIQTVAGKQEWVRTAQYAGGHVSR